MPETSQFVNGDGGFWGVRCAFTMMAKVTDSATIHGKAAGHDRSLFDDSVPHFVRTNASRINLATLKTSQKWGVTEIWKIFQNRPDRVIAFFFLRIF